MDFSALQTAKITQSEFASLVGVSRITINLWVRGKANPNRFIADRVTEILGAAKDALESGSLPVARSVAKDKRLDTLKEILGT